MLAELSAKVNVLMTVNPLHWGQQTMLLGPDPAQE